MDAGDYISILLAVIATASAIVAYLVFRSATDPLVIVYPEVDLQRSSFINLIIKNIGNGAARTVSFETSKPLPKHAFNIEVPEKMPDTMVSGPLIQGIPFLAPGQKIIITWGQYGGIYKHIGDEPVTITSKYLRAGSLPFTFRSPTLSSESKVFISSFSGVESSEHGFGPDIANEMKELNKTMNKIVSILSADRQSRES